MAKKNSIKATGYDKQWKEGHLHALDNLPQGAPEIGAALSMYVNSVTADRQTRHWVRAVQWIENYLFSAGRHYVDDILVSRLTRDTAGNDSIVNEAARNIPRPVNDLLGRYIETNIALLTENRPIPRVEPRSNRAEDEDAAELSEVALEYLWEALNMPELHREIARIVLHCGVCWLEICYDETEPRRMTVPQTTRTETSVVPSPLEGGEPLTLPVGRDVPQVDEIGRPLLTDKVEYGDLTAKIISPFEMHVPVAHTWNGDKMGWVMREYYAPIDTVMDRFAPGKKTMGLNKKDGWYLDRLEDAGSYNVQNLPLWWWERLQDLVEGPGPSLYVGTPETWSDHTVVRIFDRKPSTKYPRGRTIMVAGDQVIYDSPKDKGARAYDPRWPKRWHPYIRFRWEPMMGSIYGRSLVSKLLPKLKRVNAIDTTMIMWRRTVPMATWIIPKGSQPVEDQWFGRPGQIWDYDPRRTMGQKPEPVFPPAYPQSAQEERAQQIAEMEMIAGTEEVLRGQRPTGVTSAAMLDVLRKQALASRSSILQAWDESYQLEGSVLLQETIKHVRDDPRYAERMRVLSRDRASNLSIQSFSGSDLSDNVMVKIDTASMALVSKEAKEAKAIELMQYAPGLMQMPVTLRQAVIEQLGYKDAMVPQGADINRVKRMMAWIRQEAYERVVPMPEDDPYIFYEFLVNEIKAETFWDLNEQQQMTLLQLSDMYKKTIEFREQQMLKIQMAMAQQQQGAKGGGGGGAPPEGAQ